MRLTRPPSPLLLSILILLLILPFSTCQDTPSPPSSPPTTPPPPESSSPATRWRFSPEEARKARTRQPPPRTTAQRIEEFGDTVKQRLAPWFTQANAPWPPRRILLLALKKERTLHLYTATAAKNAPWQYICTYPILAASGKEGPKQREGDLQVPEGHYPIEALNPNSLYHLSLRIGYPSPLDRENARLDNRTAPLGGDIMLHGKAASVGCLALGDEAAEDLFILTTHAGVENATIHICPWNLLTTSPPTGDHIPPWMTPIYNTLTATLKTLKIPTNKQP